MRIWKKNYKIVAREVKNVAGATTECEIAAQIDLRKIINFDVPTLGLGAPQENTIRNHVP